MCERKRQKVHIVTGAPDPVTGRYRFLDPNLGPLNK